MTSSDLSSAGAGAAFEELLSEGDAKACCAAVYEHPAVRWLLGGELHPGGEATTRRALELSGTGAGDRLLDIASGTGTSAMLAARELRCEVVGVDLGKAAVSGARAAALAQSVDGLVSFRHADAEALPFEDGSFDAVLCECSLSTFPDKPASVGEMGRVLRPGGRVAIADVVADPERLPDELRGPLASAVCIGEALPRGGYERLLAEAGMKVTAIESRDEDAAALALRVEERLRGARLLGVSAAAGSPLEIEEAIRLAGIARRAIADGALGYAIFAASR